MHTRMTHDLVKIKIDESIEDARLGRLANAARANRVQPVDAVPLPGRVARLVSVLSTLIIRARPKLDQSRG